jgi:hypothetical protein
MVDGVATSDDHEAGRAVFQQDERGAGATTHLVDDVPTPASTRPSHAGEMGSLHPIERNAAIRADEGRRARRPWIRKVCHGHFHRARRSSSMGSARTWRSPMSEG